MQIRYNNKIIGEISIDKEYLDWIKKEYNSNKEDFVLCRDAAIRIEM